MRPGIGPVKPFASRLLLAERGAPTCRPRPSTSTPRRDLPGGWDAIPPGRYERQVDTRVDPRRRQLAPRNTRPATTSRRGTTSTTTRKRLFARYMAVYASLIGNLDQNIGRLRLSRMGRGQHAVHLHLRQRRSREVRSRAPRRTRTTGSAKGRGAVRRTWPDTTSWAGRPRYRHYPRLGVVSNTPFRLYRINAHRAGTPFRSSCRGPGRWPGRPHRRERRRQYLHVTDLLPSFRDSPG